MLVERMAEVLAYMLVECIREVLKIFVTPRPSKSVTTVWQELAESESRFDFYKSQKLSSRIRGSLAWSEADIISIRPFLSL